MNATDFSYLAGAVVAYILAELALDVLKKSPFWLSRQSLEIVRRQWSVLCYLHALINDPDLKRWARQYVILQAIKARPAPGTAESSQPLLDILQECVTQKRQVVVLGESGAGKTTALEALTYRIARQAYREQIIIWVALLGVAALLTAFHSPRWALLLLSFLLTDFIPRQQPLPVLVYLRYYDGEPVEDFLKATLRRRVGGLAIAERLQYYMKRGRLVWFLDGVNEIKSGAYEGALKGWAECFVPGHFFSAAPVVFTSRVGENPAGRLKVKEVINILDLDNNGVLAFLKAYGQDPEGGFAILEQNKMLDDRGLGRNPYWLRMIIETGFLNNPRACSYPPKRGVLFEQFARQLIQRELDKGTEQLQPSVVPVDDEMEALGHLAYAMSKAGRVAVSLKEAETEIANQLRGSEWKPRQILYEAQAATLVRLSRRENRVEFVHQLVQEFFTAYALRLNLREAAQWASDPRWWATLITLGELLQDKKALIQEIIKYDESDPYRLFLAIGLLGDLGDTEKPDALQAQLKTALIRSLRQGISREHKQAVVELVRVVGEEQVATTLGRLLQAENPVIRKNVVKILKEIPTRRTAEILVKGLKDEAIAEPVIDALVSIREQAVEPVITAIRDLRDKDKHEALYQRAVRILVKIGEPAVKPLIGVLENKNESEILRLAAIEALGQIGDVRAVESLDRALQDKSGKSQQAVARALRRIGTVQAVEPLIRALRDTDPSVSQEAAAALVEIGGPVVGPLLKLLQDKNTMVRQRAVKVLIEIGEPAVGPLIEILVSGSETMRKEATEALGKIGKPAVRPLIKVLKDGTETACQGAIDALSKIGEPATEMLITALRDRNESVRQGATETLVKIGGPAVEPLIRALQDRSEQVRQAAIEALWKIGEPALGQLIGALESETELVRQGAIEALGKIGEPALEPLVGAMVSENEQTRRAAIEALKKIGTPGIERLIRALRDKNESMRRAAAEALGQIGDVRAVEPLIRALREKNETVRQAAANALGQIGDIQALEPLIGALEDRSERVRWAAAESLGQMGDARAVGPLIGALRDKSKLVSQAAARALGKIGDTQAIDPLVRALRDKSEQVRQGAVEALGKIKDGRVIDLLIEALRDKSEVVRQTAVEALRGVGEPGLERLVEALQSKSDMIRRGAAEALGKIRDARAVEPLIRVLGDKSEVVRQAAAIALGQIGDARAVEPLIRALQDKSEIVRQEAAKALGYIGDVRAVKPLTGALGDKSESVRREAAEALGKIGDIRRIKPSSRAPRSRSKVAYRKDSQSH